MFKSFKKSRTLFVIKSNYNKVLKRINGAEGELDYAISQYEHLIVELSEALTACHKAGLTEKAASIEERIKTIVAKITELKAKKAELLAKIKVLESQRNANMALARCSCMNTGSPENVICEIEDYIATLEAELKTSEFLSTLGDN